MAIPLLLAPLLSQGLNLIANAALAKGKEWVEEKTGVNISQPMSAEDTIKLRQYELENEVELQKLRLEDNKLDVEIFKLIAENSKSENEAITSRWASDMNSDSFLAKNIRPATLIFILVVYTIMAFSSGFGIVVTPAYIELLGQWGMLIMTAYFGGRTIEKIVSDVRSKKQ